MKIILSPAKKMNDKEQCSSFGQSVFECTVTQPVYLKKTEGILAWLKIGRASCRERVSSPV